MFIIYGALSVTLNQISYRVETSTASRIMKGRKKGLVTRYQQKNKIKKIRVAPVLHQLQSQINLI